MTDRVGPAVHSIECPAIAPTYGPCAHLLGCGTLVDRGDQ